MHSWEQMPYTYSTQRHQGSSWKLKYALQAFYRRCLVSASRLEEHWPQTIVYFATTNKSFQWNFHPRKPCPSDINCQLNCAETWPYFIYIQYLPTYTLNAWYIKYPYCLKMCIASYQNCYIFKICYERSTYIFKISAYLASKNMSALLQDRSKNAKSVWDSGWVSNQLQTGLIVNQSFKLCTVT